MKQFVVLAFSLLAIVACNDTSNSVNADGTCTEQLVTDWNRMADEYYAVHHSSFTSGEVEAHYRGLNNECANFLAAHSNVACQVKDPDTEEQMTLDTSKVNNLCTDVKN